MDKSLTLREVVTEKLRLSANGHDVPFDPREAKIAGIFTEDALTLDDIDEEAVQEED